MYIRSLGIPMLGWIDDMLGMTEQPYKESTDDPQFKSAMRAKSTSKYSRQSGRERGHNKT